MNDQSHPRDRRVIKGEEVTQVTTLNVGEASTEEMLDDLLHQLDVYLNDVIVTKSEPFWLGKQTWKRDGAEIPAQEYPFEFLEWLIANTIAKIELAYPGEEPVDDLPIAQMAQVLLAKLAENEQSLQEQFAAMDRGGILKGFMFLGVVIAVHKDALGSESATTLGAGWRPE